MDGGSVRVLQNEYVHRLHSHRCTTGKLYKGQPSAAARVSIPSRYQTIVVDNSEKKGFLSNSKRFNYDLWIDDRPGPGTYVGISSTEPSSASFSRRGTGMLASRDPRMTRTTSSCGPGPGAYSLPSMLQSRNDFNQSCTTSTFHSPVAIRHAESTGPAPNQYNVLKAKVGRSNNTGAGAAFKSQTKRDVMNTGDAHNKPSPCQYNVRETGATDAAHVPLSSFKSRTSRQFPPAGDNFPGPGQYHPYEAVEVTPSKMLFPRHNYLCLSLPALPQLARPPGPGPGSYDIHGTFDDCAKSDAASSTFASKTGRWAQASTKNGLPGPAHYNPVKAGKQSFIFNSTSRWL